MKNTKYFDSVQDVNNYYPDGVPSNVIAIVGDGSNVFISSDNAGSRNQQYYSADMTNDEIVAEQVQAAEQQGYDTGYAAGQAAGGANWIDVLYLDEKAKAESFLSISDWGLNDFYKYNFAKYATSTIFIDQHGALTFISGLQTNSTMWTLIKITKDADDNAIITYNPCSINFDGTNVGAISLDGVTYYNKICLWGTLTLAAGDEVIMSCATSIDNNGTAWSLGLFGGFDDETNDPATFKCETAGTYTFGLWVDVPQVQDGQAACFVSTMFNYEGSATVPAIDVPTGETSGSMTKTEFGQQMIGKMISGVTGAYMYFGREEFDVYGASVGAALFMFGSTQGGTEQNWNNNMTIYKISGNNVERLMYDDIEDIYCTVPDTQTISGGEKAGFTIHLEAGDMICWMCYNYIEASAIIFYSGTNHETEQANYPADKVFFEVETTGDYTFCITFDEFGNPICTFGLANA